MHMFSRNRALVAASAAALALLAGCGDDVTVPVVPPPPATLTMSPSNATANVGEVTLFAVGVTNQTTTTGAYTCNTSNAAIASVAVAAGAGCRATAVAPGQATITASLTNGNSASSQLTVNNLPAAIRNLVLTPGNVSMAPGTTNTVQSTVERGATSVTPTYAVSSAAPAIATATVDANGRVTISAVAPGQTVITVSATGTGTSLAATTLTGNVNVTVSIAPPAITALNVSPASLGTIALGSSQRLTSVATQPGGAPAARITYGTSAPGVATVDSTGQVTGVAPGTATITVTATAPGNATFAAATLTQLISVVVARPANVTIFDIRQGPTVTDYNSSGLVVSSNSQVDQPVDITNVKDQIQVIINLNPFGQRVDSVVAYVAENDGSNRRAAARQVFSGGGTANEGQITFFINTADFAAAYEAAGSFTICGQTITLQPGTSQVCYQNGQKRISASAWTTSPTGVATEIQNAENNRQSMNFNNFDGWATNYVNPTRVAINPDVNLNWWGGPATEGQGRFTLVPVWYTPARALRVARVGMFQGFNVPSTQICTDLASANVFEPLGGPDATTPTALPYRFTYDSRVGRNVTTTSTTAAEPRTSTQGNANIECSLYEHPAVQAQNHPGVYAVIDNFNNPGPAVTRLNGFRTSISNPQIIANRLDYLGPSHSEADIRRSRPAVTGWVNASFSFETNTAVTTDGGVGVAAGTRTWQFRGCAATDWTALATPTGASLDECSTDFLGGWAPTQPDSGAYSIRTRGPYRVRAQDVDRLTNASTSAQSQAFGVDKTNPLIRFSAASIADTLGFNLRTSPDTLIGSPSFTGAFPLQAEMFDERGGFIDNNDVGAVVRPTVPTGFPLTIQINNTAAPAGGLITIASTGAEVPTDRGQQHYLLHAAGFLVQANFPQRAQCLQPNPAGPFGLPTWRQTTSISTTATTIREPAATILSAPNCAMWNARTLQGAPSSVDGYRPGEAINVPDEGIFRYETRVTDRAGNVSSTLTRRFGYDNTAPTLASINAPLSIAAGGAAQFTAVAEDRVEVRASHLRLRYNTAAGTGTGNVSIAPNDTLVYPQSLIDARYNDVINSPLGNTLTTPFAAPNVNTIEFTTAGNQVATGVTPSKVFAVSARIYDFLNRADAAPFVQSSILGTGIPNGTTWNTFNTNNPNRSFTAFQVLVTRDAGFNAGVGLKAQVTAPTNATNSPFVRVDFYRQTTTTDKLEYLGSSAQAINGDGGTVRYWTYLLADGQYASLPGNLHSQQTAVVPGDIIVAIGVSATGEGLATQRATIGGPAINLTVAGLAAGQTATILITGPGGFSLSQAYGNGTFLIPTNANGLHLVTASAPTTGPARVPPAPFNVNVVGVTAATATYTP
jgi:hypothetical protein